MYSLDRLGYQGHYDIYDHTGMGNTNNHLGGRATIEQAQGYSLIVYDTGNRSAGGILMPDGIDLDAARIDQGAWFQDWLAQAPSSEAQVATLWLLGANLVEERPSTPLYSTDMGVQLDGTDQGMGLNPEVTGVASFTFHGAGGSSSVDFNGDLYVLNGGCPTIRHYDGLATSGATSVATHRYTSPVTGQLGPAALVMNGNPAESRNTILQSHAWFDILEAGNVPASPSVALHLLDRVLQAALPQDCLQPVDPVDTPEEERLAAPLRMALHPNVPNPFNPMTTIRFDLAQSGHVRLRLYDVAGRLVRTLVDAEMQAGRDQRLVWDGRGETGERLASGVYWLRLEAAGFDGSRKLVMLR
jgi:hypothetical protein